VKLLILKILLIGIFLTLQPKYVLIKKINISTELISTDNFGRLYVYANNSLKKYDKNGNFLSSFSDRTNGKISSIDVSDPYILLLYYEDLNRIVFLDDRLTPIGSPFDLDQFEIFNVATVCKSKRFAVWIYDRFDKRLLHYGFNPKGIINEIKLDPLDIEQEIIYMLESGNHLYLNTGKQLLLFDEYGSYLKSFQTEIKNTFQIRNKHIIYYHDKQLYIKSVNEPDTDTLNIDFITGIKNAMIENNRLYIQKMDLVFIYKKRE